MYVLRSESGEMLIVTFSESDDTEVIPPAVELSVYWKVAGWAPSRLQVWWLSFKLLEGQVY